MSVEMVPLEIISLRENIQTVIHTLRRIGCVQVDELTEFPQVSARPLTLDRETLQTQEDLGFLVARLESLMDTLGEGEIKGENIPSLEECLEKARASVEMLMPEVQALIASREKLQAELSSLPRYENTLLKLLPIIPPSAREPDNMTVGILVSRTHVGILDSVGKRILDLTSGHAEVVASDVDGSTRAMLIVFPKEYINEIENLLGREDVSRLHLPEELGTGPPDVVLATLHRRMADIPQEIKNIDFQLSKLAGLWGEKLILWRDVLRDELDANRVMSRFGETDTTFILVGWVPASKYKKVSTALRETIGEKVYMRQTPLTPELIKHAPVALQNPPPVRPFESLVNLLALPRYGHIDPTRLMATFLPIFFGMILGDLGYGLLLLLITLGLLRKFKTGVVRDVLTVVAMGSGWTIFFGLLFGEAFGNLGEHLGIHALWFERASPEHVAGLLVMALAVGSVHISLGLIIGVWEAFKEKNQGHLLERGGMLLGVISLFFLIGILTDYLPKDFKTPAVGSLIIGIVLIGASLGWLGVLVGPIEFISLIGNILSYLRIAAIGLASVYLAKLANDTAGIVGNLVVGVIVAVLLHTLNLVLGAFSPTIHSLRLHYVEFFRKFYEGGGRPYKPFKSQLNPDSSFEKEV